MWPSAGARPLQCSQRRGGCVRHRWASCGAAKFCRASMVWSCSRCHCGPPAQRTPRAPRMQLTACTCARTHTHEHTTHTRTGGHEPVPQPGGPREAGCQLHWHLQEAGRAARALIACALLARPPSGSGAGCPAAAAAGGTVDVLGVPRALLLASPSGGCPSSGWLHFGELSRHRDVTYACPYLAGVPFDAHSVLEAWCALFAAMQRHCCAASALCFLSLL